MLRTVAWADSEAAGLSMQVATAAPARGPGGLFGSLRSDAEAVRDLAAYPEPGRRYRTGSDMGGLTSVARDLDPVWVRVGSVGVEAQTLVASGYDSDQHGPRPSGTERRDGGGQGGPCP